jgi:hypothetical protein
MDGATYTESFTMQAYTTLYGPGATVVGTITGANRSAIILKSLEVSSSFGVTYTGGAGEWMDIDIQELVTSSTGGGVYCNGG